MEVLEYKKFLKMRLLSTGLTWAYPQLKTAARALGSIDSKGRACCSSHRWWGPQRPDPGLSIGQRAPVGGEKGM